MNRKAVDYILDIPKFTKKNDAQHTKTFLKYLGNPQDGLKIIHVAGTNGKGSVCTYLNGMLRSENKRTGLFTSPHLVKMNERIVIDGEMISDEAFEEVFAHTLDAVQSMQEAGLSHPTFFEFLFGMAMDAFHQAGVEYVILETGLGGRLDATNSIENPIMTVITSIGLDHTQYLGDTYEQIAREKAGIITKGVPVFFAQTRQESDKVIEETAKNNGSLCKKIGKDAYEILGIKDKHIAFSCANAYYGTTTWKLNNIGVYQPGNAMLAMEVMRFLFGEEGHPMRWREVLSEIKWPGRMEEILPDFFVDGAHNLSAVEAFTDTIQSDETPYLILFSAVQDKEYEEMVKYLCDNTQAERYIVTHIDDVRGTASELLGEIFEKYTDRPVIVIDQAKDAFSYALEHREEGRVYCLGSLYLTGMIKEIIGDYKK